MYFNQRYASSWVLELRADSLPTILYQHIFCMLRSSRVYIPVVICYDGHLKVFSYTFFCTKVTVNTRSFYKFFCYPTRRIPILSLLKYRRIPLNIIGISTNFAFSFDILVQMQTCPDPSRHPNYIVFLTDRTCFKLQKMKQYSPHKY